MTYNRRKFIRKGGQLMGLTALSTFLSPACAQAIQDAVEANVHTSPQALAKDELFWQQIRQAYSVAATIINLNNGGLSPHARSVQDAVDYYHHLCNELPTINMWRRLRIEQMVVRRKLAELAGCGAHEIALMRNTVEALSNVIHGLTLQKGDEVVLSKQDYPHMIHAWKQRAEREGIVLKWVDWDFPIEDKAVMIQQYTSQFTDRTKVAHITHVINWNGQVLPVREIAQIARQRGIEVVVDAAQSFGQIPFHIPDLACDYLGTSLHKWLGGPFGTGMLYVRKDKIKGLYPLFAMDNPRDDKIGKFEIQGTISIPSQIAVANAIDFHHVIGTEQKFHRLQYLKNYWIDKIQHLDKIKILSPRQEAYSTAIGTIAVENEPASQLNEFLFKEYRIHCTYVNWEKIHGVRISPNVYTLTKELDVLVEALQRYVQT
ncbi:MAG: aminotransferase class V-fold PLP-dependent enzyme [Bacteroidota bacterium]